MADTSKVTNHDTSKPTRQAGEALLPADGSRPHPAASKQIFYFDVLKIIACFLVISNHSLGYIFKTADGQNKSILAIYSFLLLCSKVAVPIFIMVSGALLLASKKNSFKDSLNRIFRILVPLVGLSLLSFISNQGFSALLSPTFVIDFLREPAILPYWYLYMLIGLYLVTPFIQKMIQSFKDQDYLIFTFLFLLLPGTLILLTRLIPLKFSAYFSQAVFPEAIGYFVTGYFLANHKITVVQARIAAALLPLTLLPAAWFMVSRSLASGKAYGGLDQVNILTTVIPSLCVFILAKYLMHERNTPVRTNKLTTFISTVAATTFGIYLIHYFVIHRLYDNQTLQPLFTFNSVLGVLLLQIVTFVVCAIPIYLLKKVPLIKQFL